MKADKIEIIVEIGHSHNGSMKIAKEMIQTAKKCGAEICKFQLYDIDYIMKPKDKNYWELMATQINREQLRELKEECDIQRIEFMCSVFDAGRVAWTKELGMKRYKIASRSVKDADLLSKVFQAQKPIIASLGMWNGNGFPKMGNNVSYLYCVSKYPTRDNDLENFPKNFDKYAGFSDHTIGLKWAKLAIDRGARIIEKHFTLDRKMAGCDQKGSMTPYQLEELISYSKK